VLLQLIHIALKIAEKDNLKFRLSSVFLGELKWLIF